MPNADVSLFPAPIGGVSAYPRNNQWVTIGRVPNTGAINTIGVFKAIIIPLDLHISAIGFIPDLTGGNALVGVYEYDYINESIVNKLGEGSGGISAVFTSIPVDINLCAGLYYFAIKLDTTKALRYSQMEYRPIFSFGSSIPSQYPFVGMAPGILGPFSSGMPDTIQISNIFASYDSLSEAVFFKTDLSRH